MATRPHADSEALAQRILACVEAIPSGRVFTYGDVAEYVGASSPRIVGRVLALDDGSVPWHRVLRADGTLADHLYTEQRQRLLAEGVRFRGHRVDLANFRWDGVTRTGAGRGSSPDR
ncbi:MAG TPA: MGMT family protein [Jatrophihabitans sp.]|nr:MGMT family protein [Jatrophihabitans sp.]